MHPDTRTEVVHAVVAFVGSTLGAMFLVAMLAAGFGAMWAEHTGVPLDLQGHVVLTVGALLQTLAIGLVAVGLARGFSGDVSVAQTFPRALTGWWALAAVGGGLTVGWLPGWLAQFLPLDHSTLSVLSSAMSGDDLFVRGGLLLAICVLAPLTEELAFRGFLWAHLARLGQPVVVVGVSTLLFVVYHADPVQSPSLLPTAVFFAMLRWGSGSVVPPILAHVVNNALAMGLMLQADGHPLSISPWAAVLGTASCWGLLALAWRQSSTPLAPVG